jgi:hypothetical protein
MVGYRGSGEHQIGDRVSIGSGEHRQAGEHRKAGRRARARKWCAGRQAGRKAAQRIGALARLPACIGKAGRQAGTLRGREHQIGDRQAGRQAGRRIASGRRQAPVGPMLTRRSWGPVMDVDDHHEDYGAYGEQRHMPPWRGLREVIEVFDERLMGSKHSCSKSRKKAT